jgi:hypothetical protein
LESSSLYFSFFFCLKIWTFLQHSRCYVLVIGQTNLWNMLPHLQELYIFKLLFTTLLQLFFKWKKFSFLSVMQTLHWVFIQFLWTWFHHPSR